MRGKKHRTLRRGGISVLASVMVIAAAVAINLLVGRLPERVTKLDMTAQGLFSLSQQTSELVGGLTERVDVYWIVQSGQEDASVKHLLDRYENLSDKLMVTKVDPVENPAVAESLSGDQLHNNDLVVSSAIRSRHVSINDIYQIENTDYTTGDYSTSFAGEAELTGAINYVTSDVLPKLYALTGHGETQLSDRLTQAAGRAGMEVDTLSLLTVEYVPTDCDCLLLISPRADLSAEELAKLRDYMGRGGRLLAYTDYTGEAMPNLSAFMADYGLSLEDGIVFEGDGDRCLWGYTFYLLPNVHEHEITKPLTDGGYPVLTPVAHALSVAESLPNGVSVAKLLTTSELAFSKIGAYDTEVYEYEEGDTKGPFTLGTAVTAYVDEGEARLVWYSTSQMLSDDVDEVVSGADSDLFLNSLEWMCGDESEITIHAKNISNDYLTVPTSARARLTALFVIVLPLACVASGLVIWLKRRRRT